MTGLKFENTKRLVEEFLGEGGDGQRLQAMLIQVLGDGDGDGDDC